MNRTLFIASVPPDHEESALAFFDRHCDEQNRIEPQALIDRALGSDDARFVSDVIAHLCLLPDEAGFDRLVMRGLNWSDSDPWNGVLTVSLRAASVALRDLGAVRPRLETLSFHEAAAVRDLTIALLEADEETEEDRQYTNARKAADHLGFRSYFMGRRYTNTSFNAREEDFRKKTEDD